MLANTAIVLTAILFAWIGWSLAQIRIAREIELLKNDHQVETQKFYYAGFDAGWTASIDQSERDESLRRMSASSIDTVFDQEN